MTVIQGAYTDQLCFDPHENCQCLDSRSVRALRDDIRPGSSAVRVCRGAGLMWPHRSVGLPGGAAIRVTQLVARFGRAESEPDSGWCT